MPIIPLSAVYLTTTYIDILTILANNAIADIEKYVGARNLEYAKRTTTPSAYQWCRHGWFC